MTRLALSAAVLLALASPMSLADTAPPEWQRYWDDAASLRGLKFGPLDLHQLALEDADRALTPGSPQRFAVGHDVNLTPDMAGTWTREGDLLVWRLPVNAEAAAHLNFGFSRFDLPPGAELAILSTELQQIAGPYTDADELPHGQLWTPVLQGERAMVVLKVPATRREEVQLTLFRVAQGYRGMGKSSAMCKSGSCNTDVACLAPEDPWNLPRRSVGAITRSGVDTCTGSLLNNTNNDRRMLFSTATHCGLNTDTAVATALVYWKYESPTCRQPGSAASGIPIPRPTTTSAGLRFLAGTNNPFAGATPAGTRSDWALIELATPPAGNTFDLYWAGWDRRAPTTACAPPAANDPFQTVGRCASIHHPSVDEKRITFVETPMVLDNIAGAQGVHWRAEWDPTPAILPGFPTQTGTVPPSVTEGGSSGSPLYSAERRVVGVLSGGPSFCGATGTGLRDQYGGLFHAWEGVGTPTTRMRDLLDPAGLNPLTWDGIGTSTYSLVSAGAVKACAGTAAPPAVFLVQSDNGATAPVNFSSQSTTFSAVSFNPNPATPSQGGTPVTVSATIGAGLSGTQTLPVSATSPDNNFQLTLSYEVFPQLPGTLTLNTPAAGATNVPLTPAFGWSAATNADEYELELSRDAQFSGIVGRLFTGTIGGTLNLRANATYFWRVRAVNPCGAGAFASGSFSTVANDTVFSDGFYE
ncbi:MAG: hypothetical protein MUE46_11940 [Xanthomonadales bacterium]|jgi:hypothetical protein|nr:hypothetical protein [Xanthomonadales bacterium]